MVTVVHMMFSWGMCWFYLKFVRQTLDKGPQLSISQQASKIAPLAACVAGSFGASNVALKYIFPSFNQMLGSMTPLITVFIDSVFRGKRYNNWTWGSISFISGGLIVCGVKEVHFHFLGLSMAIIATVLRAVKSIIQSQLLTPEEKLDAVTLLYYMAPWAALFLFSMGICLEGSKPILLLYYGFEQDERAAANVFFLLVMGGLNACLLNITNFQVTADTSAVMLNVLGNVKNCIGIGVSVLIFGNPLLLEQAIGVAVCLVGVWFYQKYGSALKESLQPAPAQGNIIAELSNVIGQQMEEGRSKG
jgi:drug/metabolite transporter (DMT)-like permease